MNQNTTAALVAVMLLASAGVSAAQEQCEAVALPAVVDREGWLWGARLADTFFADAKIPDVAWHGSDVAAAFRAIGQARPAELSKFSALAASHRSFYGRVNLAPARYNMDQWPSGAAAVDIRKFVSAGQVTAIAKANTALFGPDGFAALLADVSAGTMRSAYPMADGSCFRPQAMFRYGGWVSGLHVLTSVRTAISTATAPGSAPNAGYAATAVMLVPVLVQVPPVAVADEAKTAAGLPVRIHPLSNDIDSEGDELRIHDASSHAGIVSIASDRKSLEFAPAAGFEGRAQVSYRVTDGNSVSAPGTISVEVAAGREGILARDDVARTDWDTPAWVSVLSNDVSAGGLRVSRVAQPAYGRVAINPSGLGVTFTPERNRPGKSVFEYEAVDGSGNRGTARVTIFVEVPKAKPDGGASDGWTTIPFNYNNFCDATAEEGSRDPEYAQRCREQMLQNRNSQ